MNACNAKFELRSDGLMHCSYCGSIDVPTVLAALVTKGTEYSGSDWKYGWPHKFYITLEKDGRKTNAKFYSEHLKDATPDQLAIWNRLAEDTTLIEFSITESGELGYRAMCNQAAGIVGGKREIYR